MRHYWLKTTQKEVYFIITAENRKGTCATEKTAVRIILALLAAVLAGLLIKQAYFDHSLYGFARPLPDAGGKNAVSLLNTLPAEAAGFRASSDIEKYSAETLYEKINGRAPLYLDSGFRELAARRYGSAALQELWFEASIYDMGGTLNAFSVYSSQKRHDAAPCADNPFCYISGNFFAASCGRFYVEAVGSDDRPELRVFFAQAAALLKNSGEPPVIPLILKNSRIRENSTGFSLKDAFGIRGLNNIFHADFVSNANITKVFASLPDDRAQAEKIAMFTDFWINEGGEKTEHGLSVKGLALIEAFGYYYAVFPAGGGIAGVYEAESKYSADAAVSALYENSKEKTDSSAD